MSVDNTVYAQVDSGRTTPGEAHSSSRRWRRGGGGGGGGKERAASATPDYPAAPPWSCKTRNCDLGAQPTSKSTQPILAPSWSLQVRVRKPHHLTVRDAPLHTFRRNRRRGSLLSDLGGLVAVDRGRNHTHPGVRRGSAMVTVQGCWRRWPENQPCGLWR